ncbi:MULTISPECIES: hypothetical protein [unclassified Bradyrhizobium]
MRNDKNVQFRDLDEILYNAQLRRSADLGRWLRQYLEERRGARMKNERVRNHKQSSRPVHRPV